MATIVDSVALLAGSTAVARPNVHPIAIKSGSRSSSTCCTTRNSGDETDCCRSGLGRRLVLLFGGVPLLSPLLCGWDAAASAVVNAVDTRSITDRVYLDVSLCQNLERPSCNNAEPLGRIVIGLYGKRVPQTVKNFKAMCTGEAGSSYEGSIFHKVIQGRYIQAGHQGSRDKGEVPRPTHLDRNPETIAADSFGLGHKRPGTVSLCLAENDDDESVKLNPNYRNVEFMITTGPGPAPDLDSGNIVFGTVVQGIDVVAAIAATPTFKPSQRVREFNEIAEILGDDRAANARSSWYRPGRAIVISSCGEVK